MGWVPNLGLVCSDDKLGDEFVRQAVKVFPIKRGVGSSSKVRIFIQRQLEETESSGLNRSVPYLVT